MLAVSTQQCSNKQSKTEQCNEINIKTKYTKITLKTEPEPVYLRHIYQLRKHCCRKQDISNPALQPKRRDAMHDKMQLLVPNNYNNMIWYMC